MWSLKYINNSKVKASWTGRNYKLGLYRLTLFHIQIYKERERESGQPSKKKHDAKPPLKLDSLFLKLHLYTCACHALEPDLVDLLR